VISRNKWVEGILMYRKMNNADEGKIWHGFGQRGYQPFRVKILFTVPLDEVVFFRFLTTFWKLCLLFKVGNRIARTAKIVVTVIRWVWILTTLLHVVLAFWLAIRNESHQNIVKKMSKSCQKTEKKCFKWQPFGDLKCNTNYLQVCTSLARHNPWIDMKCCLFWL